MTAFHQHEKGAVSQTQMVFQTCHKLGFSLTWHLQHSRNKCPIGLKGNKSSLIWVMDSWVYYLFFFFFAFFRAEPAAYGSSSQARGRIGAAAIPQPQQCRIPAKSVTYTTAHGNCRILNHWVRSGIEPESSWILVAFINWWATKGTPEVTNFTFSKPQTILFN